MNRPFPPETHSPFTMGERVAYLMGRVLILFSLVYIPIVFYTSTWRHYNVPKALSLQFIVLMLAACWGMIACSRKFVGSALATPAAFFFMIVMVTTLVAVNLTEAWETITFLLACLAMMVLVPKFFTRLKDFEALSYILGILCLVVDLYAMAPWYDWGFFFQFTNPLGIERFTPKPVSFMGNENYTGDFLNMALPICLMMIFCHWKKPAQLIFFTGISILNIISILYIDCNASYVGYMASTPIVFILLMYYKLIPWLAHSRLVNAPREALERWFRHLLILSILGLAVLAIYVASVNNPLRFKLTTVGSWIDVDGDNLLDGVPPIVFRLQCMDATIRKISDVPIFGIGAGNFKVIHPLYESQLERKVLGEETLARKVHNDHLYHAVEFGVFGLFGFYWLVGMGLYCCFKALTYLRRQEMAGEMGAGAMEDVAVRLSPYTRDFYFYLQLGVLGGLLTAIVSTAFSQTFVIASSASTYWLITGVAVAVFQALHRKMNGIPEPHFGTTQEALSPVQHRLRAVPFPARWAILFLAILLLGALNTYQLVGETWLRMGMIIKDIPTIAEGGQADTPNKYLLMFKCFDRAMRVYPYQMETFYILGRYYIDAVSAIDDNIGRGELGRQKIQYLGLANLDRTKLLQEGIVTLNTDIYMNPNYKWAHNNLGVLFDKVPNFTYSAQAYSRVFAVDYEQIFAHYNMGLGYMRLGDFDRAIESLEKALFMDPRKNEINPFLASCYLMKEKCKPAMAAADRFLIMRLRSQLKPLRDTYSLAQLQPLIENLEKGDVYNSIIEAKKLTTVSEEDLYRLYTQIANDLAMKQTDLETALVAVKKAEQVLPVPLNNEFYALYGNILYFLNRYPEAVVQLEQYLRIDPNNDDVRKQLTHIYTQLGQFNRALQTYQPIMEQPTTNYANFVTYYRLLLTNQYPWDQVYPFVEQAVKLGGDEARKMIIQEDLQAGWGDMMRNDPRVKALLGPNFMINPAMETGEGNTAPEGTVPRESSPSGMPASYQGTAGGGATAEIPAPATPQ